MQNIDELATRIKASGGVLEAEPVDTPWGARVFRLRDPDGFKFVISSGRSYRVTPTVTLSAPDARASGRPCGPRPSGGRRPSFAPPSALLPSAVPLSVFSRTHALASPTPPARPRRDVRVSARGRPRETASALPTHDDAFRAPAHVLPLGAFSARHFPSLAALTRRPTGAPSTIRSRSPASRTARRVSPYEYDASLRARTHRPASTPISLRACRAVRVLLCFALASHPHFVIVAATVQGMTVTVARIHGWMQHW